MIHYLFSKVNSRAMVFDIENKNTKNNIERRIAYEES